MTSKFEAPCTFRRGRHAYRCWTKEQKRRIVEESLAPDASVPVIARRHDVNTNQVLIWKKQYYLGKFGSVPNTLVPVGTIGDGGMIHPMDEVQPKQEHTAKPLSLATVQQAPASIEIELSSGIKVRMDGNIGEPALGCVVKLVRGLS